MLSNRAIRFGWFFWWFMASDNERIGASYDVKPNAYDPDKNPELFDGVPARRLVAFAIDLALLAIPLFRRFQDRSHGPLGVRPA